MKYNILFLILLVVTMVSCKRKTYEEPGTSVPVFKASGIVNEEEVSWYAGVDGIVLSSVLSRNNFGVYEFASGFYDLGCTECDPLLEIKIMDDAQLSQEEFPDLTILNVGELPLAIFENTSDFLTLHFHANNQPGNNYEWHFGDGNVGFGHSQWHTYAEPGVYQISLDVTNGGGPGDDVTITRTIYVGSPELLSVPFMVFNLPGNNWEFAIPQILPPGLIASNWTVNGEVFTGNAVQFEINSPVEVCLNYYNEILEESGSYCVVFDGGFNNLPPIDVSYNWQAQELNLGKASISYTTSSGQKYESFLPINGGPDAHFEILSVADYPESINGKVAKQVEINFSAALKNQEDPNDIILLENFVAKIAFVVE